MKKLKKRFLFCNNYIGYILTEIIFNAIMIIKIRLGLERMTRSYFKLNRVPFAVKLYIGFALLVFLLMGITYLHAYIKRPEQMQSLQLYEQKLETISSNKVNEAYMHLVEHLKIIILKLHMPLLQLMILKGYFQNKI